MALAAPISSSSSAPLAVFAVLLAVSARRSTAPPGRRRCPRAPTPGPPRGDAVAELQRAVRAAPETRDRVYAALGDAYLQRARETGDPGFYSRAERAFDAALRRDPRRSSAR